MRFACVEYTTKSGHIWRPTPERPNYLCDHKNEIDAAGYGTWTSALDGEHVPVTWFHDGKPGPAIGEKLPIRTRISMRLNRRRNKPILSFDNLDYVDNFDVMLVCFHFYGYRLMTDFLVAAKKRFPDKVFLGTHAVFSLGRLREYWTNSDLFIHLQRFMNECDIFTIANPQAVDYFDLITGTPVVYFPQFYPVSYAGRHFKDVDHKDKSIFVAGSTSRNDITWSCLLAVQLQKRFPDYVIQIVGKDDFNYAALQDANYEILPYMSWDEYLDVTSRARLVLNTDVGWTNGRVQADAAAVGTPCIGSNAGRQTELFPDLVCRDIEDTAKALSLGTKLIENADYYQSVTSRALRTLEGWSYESGPARLADLVDKFKAGKISELASV